MRGSMNCIDVVIFAEHVSCCPRIGARVGFCSAENNVPVAVMAGEAHIQAVIRRTDCNRQTGDEARLEFEARGQRARCAPYVSRAPFHGVVSAGSGSARWNHEGRKISLQICDLDCQGRLDSTGQKMVCDELDVQVCCAWES